MEINKETIIQNLTDSYQFYRNLIDTNKNDSELKTDKNFNRCMVINYILQCLSSDELVDETLAVIESANFDSEALTNLFDVIWNENSYSIKFNDTRTETNN